MSKLKTVFMGTPDFAVGCLEVMQEKTEVLTVITQPDRPKGRGQKMTPSPVKVKALEYGLPVWQPEKIKTAECVARLKELNPDLIVVVAFGQILSQEVLDIPRLGCVNVHASLLPRYRGAAPIHWSIINGETETGVTTMMMDAGLDTGDMLLKSKIEITPDMTTEELHDKLAEKGTELLISTLKDIEAGRASFEKQDDSMSTYAPMISKQDGHLDFTRSPEELLLRMRAFDPWPGAFAVYNEKGEAMKFWKGEALDLPTSGEDAGRIIEVNDKTFTVACGNRALRVTEIQVPGKKRMRTEDYLRGNSLEKGLLLR